ncbi:metal-dependent hydrolase [Flavihumibacter profundi]|uniref:metal-dependent hydrolase n=1 Tax=Flavihumibacter profundi TaxID=2716883 RepID=UPI001CC7C4A2|nr:metal-dependent hydrolase [Flavihumibacter profundi]MBZ5859208.1 metal-dependent hydrolase [Flavihumibacter profundi]
MDSITHIALGACIGEVFFDKKIGKKALLWGALAQSLPDIDFIAGGWMPVAQELLAHRGFTHSILFIAIMTPVMSLTADRVHRPHDIAMKKWLLFFGFEMLVHIFLDGFNNYGTGWLEPFSHQRFSFNAIYVADPFFSLWPGIAAAVLFLIPIFSPRRKFWYRFGILLPAFYLCYCTINKITIDRDVRKILASQHIPSERYFTTPAPLNNWLWYVVSGNDSGYYVGFRSLFDREKQMTFNFFPRNDSLLKPMANHEDLQRLVRFSQQFYTVEKWGDSLVFNDLRFGQIIGWKDPREKFVFHYFLQHPNDNKLVVQRGRFAKWDKEVALSLIQRIGGN